MASFDFEESSVSIESGDTVASALYRAGIRVFSRSFKFHRPRGLYCLTGDCPNCRVTVNGEPGVRACVTPADPEQRVTREHAWPSAELDVLSVLWYVRWLLPVGFYYKTLIRPRAIWRLVEPALRKAAGGGQVPRDHSPAQRAVCHHHPDVFVAGGGVAGLSAALAAAKTGASVVLADEGLIGKRVATGPTRTKIQSLLRSLEDEATVTLLEQASAIGVYDGPLVPVAALDRMHQVHPRRIVVATGAVERHAIFPGSDLVGVFLGRGAARLAGVHGVRPGSTAVFEGDTEESLHHLETLLAAGVQVTAAAVPEHLAARLPPGASAVSGGKVVAARGWRRVTAAVLDSSAGRQTVQCDTIVLSLGLDPRTNLLRQAPGLPVVGAGDVVTPGCTIEEAAERGRRAGLAALGESPASHRDRRGARPARREEGEYREYLTDEQRRGTGCIGGRMQRDFHHGLLGTADPGGPAQLPACAAAGFACLCEDVTVADLERAWSEGFQSTELLKRYATITMGPCQGSLCHPHLQAFVRARTDSAEVSGPTTARPPARPIRLEDAAAGVDIGIEHRTALHDRHLQLGARMEWAGVWRRPQTYGDPRKEYWAVRRTVSVMDVGTVGKFHVTGPDATTFLERLYPCHVATLAEGRLRYALVLNEAGHILDDGLICSLGAGGYYLTFTTSGAEQMEGWLRNWADTWGCRVHIVQETAAIGAINVAGPRARELLTALCADPIADDALSPRSHRELEVAGVRCRALRVAFVSHFSYELHHPSSQSGRLWDALVAEGARLDLVPHGLEALRLLRLELGHILVGQDTDFDATPAKVGLEWATKLEKPDFVGKVALERIGAVRSEQRLASIAFTGPEAPPEGAALSVGGDHVGFLSSSRFSPLLGYGVALGWLRRRNGEFPTRVRAGNVDGRVVSGPFTDPGV